MTSVVHLLVSVLTAFVYYCSFSSKTSVEAYVPTVLKVEGLQPGTRYAISFEVT